MSRAEITLHIGGVHASREPIVAKTVVGACIAVCLFDPVARVGGMNHFTLPLPGPGSDERVERSRPALHAMDLLIGAMQKVGGERRRLQAKLFGAAHVLMVKAPGDSVPERNIRFIEDFMAADGIAVLSRDLGGYLPRRIHFYTDSGKAYVKRLGQQTLRQTRAEEREYLRAHGRTARRFGDVTLFDVAGGQDRGAARSDALMR